MVNLLPTPANIVDLDELIFLCIVNLPHLQLTDVPVIG